MELREYQQKDWNELHWLVKEGFRKIMVRAATGYGKTELFIYDAIVHMSMYPNSKVVVLEDSTILVDQTTERFARNLPTGQVYAVDGERWPASLKGRMPWDFFPEVRVLICNPTVFTRRTDNLALLFDMFDENDYLITDEGHHDNANTREQIIQKWPGRVLSVTATPWRMSDYEGFDHLYETLLVCTGEQELINDGWLSPIVIHTPDKDADVIHGGRIIAGEYNDADIMTVNSKRVLVDNGIDYWERMFGKEWQTIWFCVSADHAYQVEEELRRRGFTTGGKPLLSMPPSGKSGTVHKKEMATLLQQFRLGEITHLVQVYMAKEGVDIANAVVVMFMRPTRSLTVYRQAGGRLTRPSDIHAKSYFVDMTASWKDPRVGMLQAPYRWSLEPRAEYIGGEAPIKYCGWYGHPNFMATQNCTGAVINVDDFGEETVILDEAGEPKSCGYPFGKECPGCRWRPIDKWSSETHFLETVKGDERCLMCRQGTRNSLMYEITGDEDPMREHLSHQILYMYVTKENDTQYVAHWINEDGAHERNEVFDQSVGHWSGEVENDDYKHKARVLRSRITGDELKELESWGSP